MERDTDTDIQILGPKMQSGAPDSLPVSPVLPFLHLGTYQDPALVGIFILASIFKFMVAFHTTLCLDLIFALVQYFVDVVGNPGPFMQVGGVVDFTAVIFSHVFEGVSLGSVEGTMAALAGV